MRFDTWSVLIKGALFGRPAMEARDRDGRQSTDKFAWRHEPDVVLPPQENQEVDVSSQGRHPHRRAGRCQDRKKACQRFFISEEELIGSEVAFERAGIPGL